MKNIRHIFLIALTSYAIIYLLLNEAPLYVVGGSIVGSAKEWFNVGTNVGVLIWIGLLITFMAVFLSVKNKGLKYAILVVLFILFYVVDFIFSDFLNYNTLLKRILYTSLLIIVKSTFLSLLVYFDKKQKLKVMV